jgi:disulfide bond formation protein DsbB
MKSLLNCLDLLARQRRWVYLLIALLCAGLMGYALYLQYVEFLEPCPLCMLQRVGVIALGVLALLAALHGPRERGARLYAAVATVLALASAAIAARHVYIQHLPKDQLPECTPGLTYMLETMPLGQVLRDVLHGSGECANIDWVFLGLTLPGWTMVFYLLLMVLFWLLARSPASPVVPVAVSN